MDNYSKPCDFIGCAGHEEKWEKNSAMFLGFFRRARFLQRKTANILRKLNFLQCIKDVWSTENNTKG